MRSTNGRARLAMTSLAVMAAIVAGVQWWRTDRREGRRCSTAAGAAYGQCFR